MGHGSGCHAVSDECGRDVFVDQLKGGEPGTLVVGARLRAEGVLQAAQIVERTDYTCVYG